MATPNLAHHNQLQQRQQSTAYAKERVQAIIQVRLHLSPVYLLPFKSLHTLQRAALLRSQGFTQDNNQELANLLRFISNLQSQQAQQNGMFLSLPHLTLCSTNPPDIARLILQEHPPPDPSLVVNGHPSLPQPPLLTLLLLPVLSHPILHTLGLPPRQSHSLRSR